MAFFKPNIPLGTDFLSTSQGDLLGNNQWMPAAMGKDHIINPAGSDSTVALEGRHQQVSFNDRASVLAVPGGTNGIIWHNANELWWRGGANAGVQLTRGNPGILNASTGYSFLPGGLVIQWGNQNIGGSGATITFPFTFVANPYSVVIGPVSSSTDDKTMSIVDGQVGVNKFKVQYSGSSHFTKIYWIAIGK